MWGEKSMVYVEGIGVLVGGSGGNCVFVSDAFGQCIHILYGTSS